MKRGQAFDTMMLVISVIVAVAILGVLLGFIGSINLTTTDAKMVMSDLMKTVDQRGHGLELKEGEFAEGSRIFRVDARGELPIKTDKIQFHCSSNGFCDGGSEAPLKVNGRESITVDEKISATIVVCKEVSGGDYHICIGERDNKDEPSDDCARECGLS
ncbi:MAG: hypothetical protein ACE5DI_03845 [Candidatus Micrarchaeia archaeon]